MPHQEKKIMGRNKQLMILLPITATLFVKKTDSKEPEPNTLDFHLKMIKQIDTLLNEHKRGVPPVESFHIQTPPLNPPQPSPPIEPRPPLNKAFPHQDIAWEPIPESPRIITPVIPEEFKTELSFNPEFRFITGREFIDTISQTQPSSEDRVEIIDFNTLIKDDTTLRKTLKPTPIKNKIFDEDFCHKKIEIIDTRTMKQEIPENLLNVSAEQDKQIDKKVRLYFPSSKASTEKKQEKLEMEQTYIPVDYEELTKELKKKLDEEEKKIKQLEHKYEELEEMERKKTEFEKNKLEKLELEYEELEKMERKKPEFEKKKQEPNERETNIQKKVALSLQSPQDIKKQQKEQKRLKRLELRQWRIEERRRKKEEKQTSKLKQKGQHLEMKGNVQQKTGKVNISKEEKHASALTFDEDLKKVLNMTDTLLSELPEHILNDFIESEDYKLYEKVMNKYKIR